MKHTWFRKSRETPPVYVDVPASAAIAQLCHPTGDPRMDVINSALIDLLQRRFLKAMRPAGSDVIGYAPTEAGLKYVEDHYADAVEQFLEAHDDY